MLRWPMAAVSVVSVVALVSTTGVASANPTVPEPGAPCPARVVGAMTFPPAGGQPLVCDAGGRWLTVDDPYPVSERWLSYGPAIGLHGQGRRNPSMLSGDWIATPSTSQSACQSVQVAVIPGEASLGPPRIDGGEPGRPLTVAVEPTMATIELSGDCSWQRMASNGS